MCFSIISVVGGIVVMLLGGWNAGWLWLWFDAVRLIGPAEDFQRRGKQKVISFYCRAKVCVRPEPALMAIRADGAGVSVFFSGHPLELARGQHHDGVKPQAQIAI